MDGWVEGMVMSRIYLLVCALCFLWHFAASVSSRPAVCWFLGHHPFSVMREGLEGSIVVLKCIMPVPKSNKLKLHRQLPLYLLAFR